MKQGSALPRTLLFLAGSLLAMPVLALTALALVTPVTASGGLYLLGGALLAAGLILAPWQVKGHFMLAASGLIVILVVAGIRFSLTRNEDAMLKVIVLPAAKGTRSINVLIDERDSLLFGEALMHFMGGVSSREHKDVVAALSAVYQEARTANGVFASPIVSTYLSLQRPAAFDAVVIEPGVGPPSQTGVIFLHGFMGNVAIQCWQIARAVGNSGAVTVCPSTGWVGDWWTPEGEAIVRATFAYLHERGIKQIYLGGFSNGGNGVGSLISTLGSEPDIKGLFFIAGMRNAAAVRETNLPVLVIQGINDERMPVEGARQFVQEVGPRATFIELEADHFLIVKQPRLVQEAIGSWLGKLVIDN
jgi:pimeloyl-ACP methyl ester carboxylesterase